jgi:hypothetical protein
LNERSVPVLRLIGLLSMFSIAAGGFLVLDYNMARQLVTAADEEADLPIRDYLGGLSGRIASLARSADPSGLPRDLADMLPRPPEGWTVRPATKDDTQPFLPRAAGTGEALALGLVADMVNAKVPDAAEVAILTYERGERRVIVKAVRYPDVIFSGVMATDQRLALQTTAAAYRGLFTMTVRGLDITEDMLPDDMRGRLFMADVGGQIHLRVLASRRMSDADLVDFFETLHVKAMNAAVVKKQDGLGDVPVIVLASALDRDARNAYDSDRAARSAARLAAHRADYDAAQASLAADAAADAGDTEVEPAPKTAPAMVCDQGAGGIKRCRVGD